jgi:hypothetical protein
MRRLLGEAIYRFKNNGDINAGGSVTTKLAGTGTDKATYNEYALTTPLANPVVLDSNGRSNTGSGEIWLESGSYDITVKDSSGNTINTISDISDEVSVFNYLYKTADYTITTSDLENVDNLILQVDASGADVTITMPSPADYDEKVIEIKAWVDPAGNSVIVNSSADTEIWTGYAKHDFARITSNASNNIILQEYVTVEIRGFLTADDSIASASIEKIFAANYTVSTDIGGWWDSVTNHRLDVAFDCYATLSIGLLTDDPTIAPTYLRSTVQKYDVAGAGVDATFSQSNMLTETRDHDSGHYIELYAENSDSTTAHNVLGDAAGDETFFTFKVIRRRR